MKWGGKAGGHTGQPAQGGARGVASGKAAVSPPTKLRHSLFPLATRDEAATSSKERGAAVPPEPLPVPETLSCPDTAATTSPTITATTTAAYSTRVTADAEPSAPEEDLAHDLDLSAPAREALVKEGESVEFVLNTR